MYRMIVWIISAVSLPLVASQMVSAEQKSSGKIGVVLMHGKSGMPGSLSGLASALRSAGIVVVKPEMPWSRGLAYAKPYLGSMSEIDAAVSGLRRSGATRIFVGGQSMGANAALGYGARHGGLAGLILLAPGHVPGIAGFDKRLAGSVAKARGLVAAGKGGARASFQDSNQANVTTVSATPDVYLSWFAPDGPAVMARNAANIKGGTPVFCADGASEPRPRCNYIRARLKPNARNTFVSVPAGHRQVPNAAKQQVLNWLGRVQ